MSLIEYIKIVNQTGLGSREARDFKKQHKDDKILMQRIKMIDMLFSDKSRILEILSDENG